MRLIVKAGSRHLDPPKALVHFLQQFNLPTHNVHMIIAKYVTCVSLILNLTVKVKSEILTFLSVLVSQ